jgi:NAD(P)-dependent dehydrogenase (short-subunit alcohol dehydrogenase family)
VVSGTSQEVSRSAVAAGKILAFARRCRGRCAVDPEQVARITDEMARLHPLGRVGHVEEVADAVAHLLSDDASFITSATVPVDGVRSVLAHDPVT